MIAMKAALWLGSVAALTVISPAVDASHFCPGQVQTVDVAGNGDVKIAVAGMGIEMKVCSVTASHGVFSVESCKATLSLLMTAFATNRTARLYFSNDANTSCAKGNFINLSDHGLYYLKIEQ